jgi:DNA-directed RNA polymerase subunit RPC12/RpoP
MAKLVSELKEEEYTAAVISVVKRAIVLAVLLVIGRMIRDALPASDRHAADEALLVLLVLGTLVVLIPALYLLRLSRIKGSQVTCPYCEEVNVLVEPPMEDFICEHCKRTIYYQDGHMVPITVVACPKCNVDYKVASIADHYICDRCGLSIPVHPKKEKEPELLPEAVVARAQAPAVRLGAANQTVLMRAYPPSAERQLIAILRREMGVNEEQARMLLQTTSQTTPLIVAFDIPALEAESLRRELEALGAQVTVRDEAPSRV